MDGQEAYQKFQEMSKDPMKYNEELLLKILDDNKDTEYRKKYDFANIKSVKEFQEKVPVSVYDDYADYIVRETENDEEHLLCAYHVGHYNKSSGTLSVKVVMAFREYLSLMFSSPDEAAFPRTDTNTRYLHARFGLMDKGIAQGAASFCSFFLETLRYIEQKWELLVNDIEKGTIDESIKMTDDVREKYRIGNAFSRFGKLSFPNLMYFVLQSTHNSISINYSRMLDSLLPSSMPFVSKQAISKARQGISHGAFMELFRLSVSCFYQTYHDLSAWNGFQIYAVDGSTIQIPEPDENSLAFGGNFCTPEAYSSRCVCLKRLKRLYLINQMYCSLIRLNVRHSL